MKEGKERKGRDEHLMSWKEELTIRRRDDDRVRVRVSNRVDDTSDVMYVHPPCRSLTKGLPLPSVAPIIFTHLGSLHDDFVMNLENHLPP